MDCQDSSLYPDHHILLQSHPPILSPDSLSHCPDQYTPFCRNFSVFIIMLNYNRQMAKMHENVKNKLVEIRKGLDTKAKEFSVAKEAVRNLFLREGKKIDIENMQEQTNLFSKLSSTLSEQIGNEEDAAHGYNEKISDIEKEYER